ncbi:MAG: N-acetylmuramoyl-L-alanine amidase [Pelotomaculum sp. PtaB.Bin104]|nr:MAG: N-acetylmuramoyl-L-alanine amidase [Pelotomaculum sp. PtaB.Bin104]
MKKVTTIIITSLVAVSLVVFTAIIYAKGNQIAEEENVPGELIPLPDESANVSANMTSECKITDNSTTGQNAAVSSGNKELTGNQLKIVYKPVLITEYRKQLAREYANMHYGEYIDTIKPQTIIIHWTASDNMQGTYSYFYREEATVDREYGRLNLTSHFLVDRDGTIYQLTPETFLNRHAIGLNWCSIGIENVGGVNGKQDLTEAQLKANIQLVKYLKDKYPSITYLLGHYQQDHAKKVGLWKEKVSSYYTGKPDPVRIFMQGLIDGTKDYGLTVFEP